MRWGIVYFPDKSTPEEYDHLITAANWIERKVIFGERIHWLSMPEESLSKRAREYPGVFVVLKLEEFDEYMKIRIVELALDRKLSHDH